MPASDHSDPPLKEILNVDEAAAYLGVSTKTFFKVLREGEMPGRKVGREWKFSRRALEAWVGAGCSREFLDVEDRDEEAPAAKVAAAPAAATTSMAARTARPAPPRRVGAPFQDEDD